MCVLPFLELEVSKRGKQKKKKEEKNKQTQNTLYDLHVKDSFTLSFPSLRPPPPPPLFH